MKILLVEDDRYTASKLIEALIAHYYLVDTVEDSEAGLDMVKAFEYDLLLLDVALPELDGISLCHQIRSQGYQMPILFLTAKDSPRDAVLGLEAGADDYVVKPYDLSELMARIRALLRRGRATIPTVLTWENLQLNLSSREVTYKDKLLHLTPKEYGLLELFLRNPQRLLSRDALIDHIWSLNKLPGDGAVTTQIKGLRQKLKAAGMNVELIETVYGLGYRLRVAPEGLSPKEDMENEPAPGTTYQQRPIAAYESRYQGPDCVQCGNRDKCPCVNVTGLFSSPSDSYSPRNQAKSRV